MKKFGLLKGQSLASRLAEKGILNHMDVGVNVGSLGFGIDVGVPMGDYVRLRAGYTYIPGIKLKRDFTVESSGGSIQRFIDKWNNIDLYQEIEKRGYDINDYPQYKDMLDRFGNVTLSDQVTMGVKPTVHQFKFLIDVLPFRNNKHWSFTAGFFAGPSGVGEAVNLEKERAVLDGVLAYNELYVNVMSEQYNNHIDELEDKLRETGIAGFRLGTFKDGDIAIMVPAKDATARAKMEVNKVRPYIGFGYNTELSKDKRWKLNVDAGILILGKPRIYVDNIYKIDMNVVDYDNYVYDVVRWNDAKGDYDTPENGLEDIVKNHVNIVEDTYDIPGKVGDMVHTLSKFKVYPNASVTFSYRLY